MPIILLTILSLPALAALGFDLYLAYGETMDLSQPMALTSVGWLWLTYHPDSYKLLKETIEPDTWALFIKPVLMQKTVVIALLPLYIAVPAFIVMKTFGLGRYEGQGLINGRFGKGGRKGFSYKNDFGEAPRKRTKYKRN